MPDTVPSDASTRRAALSKALANANRAAANLAEFEQAAIRCCEGGWDLDRRAERAQQTLTEAESAEPARLAQAFTKRDKDSFPPPLYAAQEALVKVKEAATKNDQLLAALQHEASQTEGRLRTMRVDLYIALADYVIHSNEYVALQTEHKAAWHRLRSVRATFDAIHQALHGQTPQAVLDQAQLAEPLQAGRQGYPVDQALIDSWSNALDAIIKGDLDAKLPSNLTSR